jgi:hypothetical protein
MCPRFESGYYVFVDMSFDLSGLISWCPHETLNEIIQSTNTEELKKGDDGKRGNYLKFFKSGRFPVHVHLPSHVCENRGENVGFADFGVGFFCCVLLREWEDGDDVHECPFFQICVWLRCMVKYFREEISEKERVRDRDIWARDISKKERDREVEIY